MTKVEILEMLLSLQRNGLLFEKLTGIDIHDDVNLETIAVELGELG